MLVDGEVGGSRLIEAVTIEHMRFVHPSSLLDWSFSVEVPVPVELVHGGDLCHERVGCGRGEAGEVGDVTAGPGGGGTL